MNRRSLIACAALISTLGIAGSLSATTVYQRATNCTRCAIPLVLPEVTPPSVSAVVRDTDPYNTVTCWVERFDSAGVLRSTTVFNTGAASYVGTGSFGAFMAGTVGTYLEIWCDGTNTLVGYGKN